MKLLATCSAIAALAQASILSPRELCDANLATGSSWGSLLPADLQGNRWIFVFDAQLFPDIPKDEDAFKYGAEFVADRVMGQNPDKVTLLISSTNGWNLLHFGRPGNKWTKEHLFGILMGGFWESGHSSSGINFQDIIDCLAEVYSPNYIYYDHYIGWNWDSTMFSDDFFNDLGSISWSENDDRS